MFYSVESSVLFREINIVSALADVCCFKTDARTGVKAILMFALQLFLDAYASQGLASGSFLSALFRDKVTFQSQMFSLFK